MPASKIHKVTYFFKTYPLFKEVKYEDKAYDVIMK